MINMRPSVSYFNFCIEQIDSFVRFIPMQMEVNILQGKLTQFNFSHSMVQLSARLSASKNLQIRFRISNH